MARKIKKRFSKRKIYKRKRFSKKKLIKSNKRFKSKVKRVLRNEAETKYVEGYHAGAPYVPINFLTTYNA